MDGWIVGSIIRASPSGYAAGPRGRPLKYYFYLAYGERNGNNEPISPAPPEAKRLYSNRLDYLSGT